MKKRILKFRTKDKNLFDQVVKGQKTVETRANTPRYSSIKAGDTLVIVCGKEKINKSVKSVQHFKNIDAMVRKISIDSIIPGVKSLGEAKKVYFSFPGYKEKIERFGIVAFEI